MNSSGPIATIGRDLGRILQALAGLIFISTTIPIVWGEYYAIPALLISGLIPVGVGWLLSSKFDEATDPGKLHGMVIAATGWLCVGIFGSLPFLLIAWTVELGPVFVHTPSQTPTLEEATPERKDESSDSDVIINGEASGFDVDSDWSEFRAHQ